MASFINRMQELSDRLSRIPEELGVPQYRPIAIQTGITQMMITPYPRVVPLDNYTGVQVSKDARAYLESAVSINPDDLVLEGVTRSIPEQTLRESIFIIDAEIAPGTEMLAEPIYTGTQARATFINTSDLLTYLIIIRPNRTR